MSTSTLVIVAAVVLVVLIFLVSNGAANTGNPYLDSLNLGEANGYNAAMNAAS